MVFPGYTSTAPNIMCQRLITARDFSLQVDRFGGMGLLSAVVPGRDAREGFGEARGKRLHNALLIAPNPLSLGTVKVLLGSE